MAKNSWDSYITYLKDHEKAVEKAGIFGHDGNLWAGDFTLNPTETNGKKDNPFDFTKPKENAKILYEPAKIQVIANCLKSEKYDSLTGTGIELAKDVKMMFVRNFEGKTIVGKKGNKSIMCAATKKAVIVIVLGEGHSPTNVTIHTYVQGTLEKSGY